MRPDLAGREFGGYLLEEEIGRGGMAWVWRARHQVLGRPAALKILAPELARDERFVERFLREARAAAQLEHPNIVPVYETGEADSYHYIAMKLLEGRTLREGIERGPTPPEEVALILGQVAEALDYAHSRGFVHRDIKPGNIMIDDRFHVTLTDFGIARAADDMSITATGLLVGTPAYMAPEQAQGLPATSRSDIYALGILVYELLAGATPFGDRIPHAIILAHLHEPPQPVHERSEGIYPTLSAVVEKALAKEPAARFATAGEFSRAFSDALPGERASITALPPGSPKPNPASETRRAAQRDARRKRIVGFGLITLLVLAFLVATAVMYGGGPGSEVDIRSEPAGAVILIGGVPRGEAPLVVDDLHEGTYSLRAELPSYAPHEEPLVVEGGEDLRVAILLEALPPEQVVEVTRAVTASGLSDGTSGLREPVDSRAAFAPDETVYAYLLVRSDAYGVRDIGFTFTSRWYGPDGTLRATSPPQRAMFTSDGQVWYLSANALAGDVDPGASGQVSTVELYVDDVIIQTLQLRVE